MVLYDLKFRNVTSEQIAEIQHVLFNDKKVFVSERPISMNIDQDPSPQNRHLWTLMIYHLKPKMMVRAQDLVIDKQIFPVMIESKK